ncbi:MAG: hypothetical protein Q7S89_03175 [bacterium]|nr:hypothetical protein [bacterium]
MPSTSPTAWADIVVGSLQDQWGQLLGFLPKIIGAVIVVLIGWAIAAAIGGLIARFIEALYIEKLLENLKIKKAFRGAGVELDFGKLIGWLVKWFLLVVTFIAAVDILNLPEVNEFLRTVAQYIPTTIAAALILFVGFVAAAFVGEVVEKAVKASGLHSGQLMATVAKWSIIVFTVMAALVQLGIAAELIQIILVGFVSMAALAGGLAFGLGGRAWAEDMLASMRKDLGKKR